jgi:hypothetical protein
MSILRRDRTVMRPALTTAMRCLASRGLTG